MLKIIITAGYFFIVTALWAQDDAPVSQWINSPVKIDGNPAEWHKPLRFYDSNTKLFYAFANDGKNLYICFQAPDEMNQQKIMHAGMKISLISRTSDKHKVSVSFPLAQQYVPVKQPAGEDSTEKKFQKKNMKNNFLVQNTVMEVKGFTDRNGIIATNDSSGINTAINWDEGNILTYEISVPFAEFYGTGYTSTDLTKYITMDVEINAVSRANHADNAGNANSFGGRGRGGRMGGGQGHHRNNNTEAGQIDGSQPFSSRTAMFEKAELKQKFILASAVKN